MSAAGGELTLGFNTATVLEQVRWLPHVRLRRQAREVTVVCFHGRTIARLDGERQRVEIAVAEVGCERVLAEHPDAERGPLGVSVHLISPSRVRTAVELIRRGVDETLYSWQRSAANP